MLAVTNVYNCTLLERTVINIYSFSITLDLTYENLLPKLRDTKQGSTERRCLEKSLESTFSINLVHPTFSFSLFLIDSYKYNNIVAHLNNHCSTFYNLIKQERDFNQFSSNIVINNNSFMFVNCTAKW